MTRSPLNFKSQSKPRVAIIGAGAAGLSCGYALAKAGADVTIYEKGQIGQGALWASGGMLAAGFESAEANANSNFVQLAKRGLTLWHELANTLGAASFGYRQSGTFIPVFANDPWAEELKDYADKTSFSLLERPCLPEMVADQILHFPHDAELDNRLIPRVFADAIKSLGGKVFPDTRILSVDTKADGISLKMDAGEVVETDYVLCTTGLSTQIDGLPIIPLEPVKGQMLALDGEGITLPACIRAKNVYLSQKSNGRIVVGATSEPGLADAHTQDATITALRRRAETLVPALQDVDEMERWAGVRPKSPDGLPILDCLADGRVVFLNGLYRNGVLLAPAMAELITAFFTGHESLPTEFRLARFD